MLVNEINRLLYGVFVESIVDVENIMDCMYVSPQNLYAVALTPNVIGDGAFGK